MEKMCILCQKNPPIENSHVVPKFIIKYLKNQSSANYLKQSWNYNQKLQDGWKGAYLCAKCDNETVSDWEDHFKKKWFSSFVDNQENNLLVDKKVVNFLLSLFLRYSGLFINKNPSRVDSYLPEGLQKITRDLITNRDAGKVGEKFFIYTAFIHPIFDDQRYLTGINQLLFNSYQGILLPAEGKLPPVTVVWIPSFLFVFSKFDLNSIEEIRKENIGSSLRLDEQVKTNIQNYGLLNLFRSILNKQVSNMNISQTKQVEKDLNKLKESIKKDQNIQNRMCYKAGNWDQQLEAFRKNGK